jgi:hypothetical protein
MDTKRYTEADGYWIEARPQIDQGCLSYALSVGSGGKKAPKAYSMSRPAAQLPALGTLPRGISNATHFWAGTILRRGALAWIEALWAECEASVAAAIATESAQEATIAGLAELRAAWEEQERYRREFRGMMNDGENDGACPPRPAAGDVAAISAKYPAAALYLRAEDYEVSGHWAKADAGEQAKALILAGDLAGATAALENWLEDHEIEVD